MPEVSDTNLPGFVRRMKRPATYYFGFNQTNAPFDSVYMRRAFGAVIDRQRFVAEVLDGKGLPLSVFMPPDVPGGDMSVNESVGFNPAYAREQMILAGYPDCAGLPPVLVETFDNAEAWADFLVASAVEHLGCPAETFEVRTVDYSNWWFEGPLYEHIFAGGWGPLFPDAHGWQGEWLHCTADNYLFRSCSAVDDWLVGAAETTDESARVELYRRVESAFFGPEGEMPVIPLFQPLSNVRVRAGIDGPFETDGGFSAVHWDAYSINREQR
jgi:peptide/nickel transport system substrate-binding protein